MDDQLRDCLSEAAKQLTIAECNIAAGLSTIDEKDVARINRAQRSIYKILKNNR